MRIIDAHAHIGHKVIVAGADSLVESMDGAGIDRSLVIAGRMFDCATEVLLAEIAGYGGRLHAIGSVSPFGVPLQQGLAKLEEQLRSGLLRAVKFYTGYEHYFPYDSLIREHLRLCESHGVPAVFHTGDCYCKIGNAKLKYAHPLQLDELAVDMPDLTIVMAHMGHPWTPDGKEVCYKNPNVFADCSGFVCDGFTPYSRTKYVEQVRDFIEYAGNPEKLLFGTDWPITDQKSYVEATLEALEPFGPAATELVMGGNALRVYGIKAE